MKMRMIQKANVIQERFTQETQELERRQSLYNKKQSHNNNKSEEEEYVNFCQDSTFRIHILEKRLAEHKKTGTNRYNILEQRIANDPRLAALYSQDSYWVDLIYIFFYIYFFMNKQSQFIFQTTSNF